MRHLALISGISFLLALSTPAQRHSRPVPRGLSEAANKENQSLEPPAVIRKEVDSAEIKREAAELQQLATAISDQVDQVARNQLPKDLNDNLKRVEKLAKHLRSEISP
jgi:hypothetical protein